MADDQAKGSEAVAVAIQLETDGMKFYEGASGKTADPFGKRMFLSLVEDEKRHLKLLHDIAKDIPPMDECDAGAVFKGAVRTIFKEVTDNLQKRLEADPDDVEAVKIAMEFEEKGYKFYEKAAQEATDENEKKLFDVLAVEENGHWAILEDTYTYLTAPEQWDIRENPPLLD